MKTTLLALSLLMAVATPHSAHASCKQYDFQRPARVAMKMPTSWIGGSSAQCDDLHRQAKAFLEEEYQKAVEATNQAFHNKLDVKPGNANSQEASKRAYERAEQRQVAAQRDRDALKSCTCVQWEDISAGASRDRQELTPEPEEAEPAPTPSTMRTPQPAVQIGEGSRQNSRPPAKSDTQPAPVPSAPPSLTPGEQARKEMVDPFGTNKAPVSIPKPGQKELVLVDPFPNMQHSGATLRPAPEEPTSAEPWSPTPSPDKSESPSKIESQTMEMLKAGAEQGVKGLFIAASRGDTVAVERMINQGLNVNAADAEGWTPLMFAALGGYASTAQTLIAAGATVNVSDQDGNTPLIAATFAGSLETVRILITNGADISAKNSNDVTALIVAQEKGYVAIAAWLREEKKSPPK